MSVAIDKIEDVSETATGWRGERVLDVTFHDGLVLRLHQSNLSDPVHRTCWVDTNRALWTSGYTRNERDDIHHLAVVSGWAYNLAPQTADQAAAAAAHWRSVRVAAQRGIEEAEGVRPAREYTKED